MTSCILCGSSKTSDYFRNEKHYFLDCEACTTVFRHPATWISPSEEKKRYLTHQNDVEDAGYQNFVLPLVEEVLARYSNKALGLDFGAGTGPVAAKLLTEKGYSITLFDPFFHPDTSAFDNKYDFIICSEVIEHFHHPLKEFTLLKSLLTPSGSLFCMTNLWEGISKGFEHWWYKNDSTHTLFYNTTNLTFIQQSCNFKNGNIKNNVIELN